MLQYTVKSNHLLHNRRHYEKGQLVELDECAARPLLKIGAIGYLDAKAESTQISEPSSAQEQPAREIAAPAKSPDAPAPAAGPEPDQASESKKTGKKK